MRNQFGRARIALVTAAGAALAAALVAASLGADPASGTGGTVNLGTVSCTATVDFGGGPVNISQNQEISVTAFAPDTNPANTPFEVSFPGGTATLPATGAGLPIQAFNNLFTTWEVVGGTFVDGTQVQTGNYDTNGTVISGSATVVDPTHIKLGAAGQPFADPNPPGSITPGPFTTANWTVNVLPNAGEGNMVLLKAKVVTVNALLNVGAPPGSVAATTCNLPDNTPATTTLGAPVGSTSTSTSTSSTSSTSTTASTTTTIGPSVPTLSIDDVTVTEGDKKTVKAHFTVTLSQVATGTVKVDYATQDGSASSVDKADFTAKDATLSIPKNQLSKSFDIIVSKDTIEELTETFDVNLSNPVGATIADGTGVGTILDTDPVHITIDDATIVEADSGTLKVSVTVHTSRASDGPVKAKLTTVDGTASSINPGKDFTKKGGSVTVKPGQTSAVIQITTIGDLVDEADEQFTIVLSEPQGGVLDETTATVTIQDNDGTPE